MCGYARASGDAALPGSFLEQPEPNQVAESHL